MRILYPLPAATGRAEAVVRVESHAPHTGSIPVIDIFAGPGGLSEGFSQLRSKSGRTTFRVCLSIEMDPAAHRTLELRSFFRQFAKLGLPDAYYEYIRGELGRGDEARKKLFAAHPDAARRAEVEAWRATLGKVPLSEISDRIKAALGPSGSKPWVLIGGPPCQAYSIVGRSRMKRRKGDEFAKDHRHVLYREYLRILADHEPTVFIMENVKGLLSSKHEDQLIVEKIIRDLQSPGNGAAYRLFPLTPIGHTPKEQLLFGENGRPPRARDFVIEAERYGIPQARHRVIFMGIAESFLKRLQNWQCPTLTPHPTSISVADVLSGLPPLRSGVSRDDDSKDDWKNALSQVPLAAWFWKLKDGPDAAVAARILTVVKSISAPHGDRGGLFVDRKGKSPRKHARWFNDKRIGGFCNHESRRHIEKDLHRYLFAACYADVHGISPKLRDFPTALLPEHKNVKKALGNGMFNDRFRVQRGSLPATTITSHIAKDGHYFIHPDARQCRSLTVREAARLQTFPDNYFFEGNRTEQYRQVGNAVPPLLARQIAAVVHQVLLTG